MHLKLGTFKCGKAFNLEATSSQDFLNLSSEAYDSSECFVDGNSLGHPWPLYS